MLSVQSEVDQLISVQPIDNFVSIGLLRRCKDDQFKVLGHCMQKLKRVRPSIELNLTVCGPLHFLREVNQGFVKI